MIQYEKPKTLSQLEAENAKLREEVEQWHRLTAGIELPDYPITEFKPKDLERENSKLRELVRDSASLLDATCDTYYEDDYHAIIERACELGIEVE